MMIHLNIKPKNCKPWLSIANFPLLLSFVQIRIWMNLFVLIVENVYPEKIISKWILFNWIGNKHQNFLSFIKKQHKTKISYSFFRKSRRCNWLQAFHLTKMCRVTKHVNKHELCQIPMSIILVIFTNRSSNRSTFFSYNSPLLCCSFASTYSPNQVPDKREL